MPNERRMSAGDKLTMKSDASGKSRKTRNAERNNAKRTN